MTNPEPSRTDQDTTLAELRAAVRQFVYERNWDIFHSPKNLAASIAIEAAELMEHFQWLSVEESRRYSESESARAAIADELADVLIYCFSLANQAGIDLSSSVLAKLERNAARFPLGYMPETRVGNKET